ncbi:hypothetical protein CD175_19445 [Pseudomonas laurylsulfatiphila]|uniref:Uncharacterized protein n=1 Tax=Pseudomonas laurylsulfatiphila TaxID=2011015 RepID=A0A2S6FHS8_9PSED|nr:hypothetical protein CD175_19445 [Pseudomonas laurylsulfatiphila]
MVVNDNAGNLVPRGALRLIVSRLAPTENAPARLVSAASRFAGIPSSRQPCRIANIHRQSSPAGL